MAGSAPFDPERHPRGFHGRWTAGPGKSSNAHAMRGPVRPRPHPDKIAHAVVPRPSIRGVTLKDPVAQGGD